MISAQRVNVFLALLFCFSFRSELLRNFQNPPETRGFQQLGAGIRRQGMYSTPLDEEKIPEEKRQEVWSPVATKNSLQNLGIFLAEIFNESSVATGGVAG